MDDTLRLAAQQMSWPNYLLRCAKYNIDPDTAYLAWSSERSRDPEKLVLLRRAFTNQRDL